MLDSVSGLALWVVLLLVLVLVKANRNPRAWLILLPLGAVFTLWGIIRSILPVPSELTAIFNQLLATLAIGFSGLLLLGHKIGNRNRFVTFVLALVFMVLLSITGSMSLSGTFSQKVTTYTIMSSATVVPVLLAFVFAALCCRKKFSYPRLTIWLGVWTTAGYEIFILVYSIIGMITLGDSIPINKAQLLLGLLVGGLVTGGILFAILLPFMILAAKSGFFHDRLFACLRLKSMEDINKPDKSVDLEDLSADTDNGIQLPGQEDWD